MCVYGPFQSKEDFPKWLNLLIGSLKFSSEALVYETLTTFYRLFELEKSQDNIRAYNSIIYSATEFQEEGIARRITFKLFEIIDINDFKTLFLNYYNKLLKINFKFINNFLVQSLSPQNFAQENFSKISKLWQYTCKFVNTECNYILNNTIEPIFRLRKMKNQIVSNSLKNWITFSPLSFQIILDSLIKHDILLTNWIVRDGKLYYNHPFDCTEA